jgi:hypothetical protein
MLAAFGIIKKIINAPITNIKINILQYLQNVIFQKNLMTPEESENLRYLM